MTEKRWISLLVENDIGVLARISGLFSGKSYNLDSLTVGPTEDLTISRMTIGLTSDERTFEQIKKQLNRPEDDRRCLEPVYGTFGMKVVDQDAGTVLLESLNTEEKNNELIKLLEKEFSGRMEIVRGGSVAVKAICLPEQVIISVEKK